MSQNDFSIANATASNVRSDLTNAFRALASCSSGSTEPSTTYANMLWYDTSTGILKMRNEADSGWCSLFIVDQTPGNLFSPINFTQVKTVAGDRVGYLANPAESVWTTGTSTEAYLITPAKLKATIEQFTIGWDQTWQDVSSSRSSGLSYRNTTGKPIQVVITFQGDTSGQSLQASTNNSTWVTITTSDGAADDNVVTAIIPPSHYYRLTAGTVLEWTELR